MPRFLAMASKGPAAVRVAAVENLTHLGYAPALPVLAKLSLAGEGELSAAARACLSNFPGQRRPTPQSRQCWGIKTPRSAAWLFR